ncbi:MAG: LapA family protein [Oligoflexales bacterium]|nr:LapA family protein [Oligoflexales bacterium]
MFFLKKLISFWFLILLISAGGYFCALNLDFITVNVPFFGAYRMRLAVAFIFSFFIGSTVTVCYFGFDSVRKSWKLRQKEREIKILRKNTLLDKQGDSDISDSDGQK